MKRLHQRGLGLVELMVGITVGMVVAAGASIVAVNQINEHRRLMLETQIQQDLRAAADLIQQEVRRAGYDMQATRSVWAPPAAVGTAGEKATFTATTNPYTAIVKSADEEENVKSLTYTYATGGAASAAPRDAEHFGVRWLRGTETLYVMIGKDNWQPITDPGSVRITDFDIDVEERSVAVPDFCDRDCGSACPTHTVRRVSFKLVGQARHDANVRRTLSGTERVRADAITGACPA